MRTIYNLNSKWAFSKEATCVPTEVNPKWNFVNLPHNWNNIDGQDGGNDYYRGVAYYAKKIEKVDLPQAERYFIEIKGANSSADLIWNAKELCHHDGGYSTWRVDVTDVLDNENLIVFRVDNTANDKVYPQVADFTFYGGLYRDVNLICVNESHFDLEYCGGPGIKVTPVAAGSDADVEIEVFTTNQKPGQTIRYTVTDKEGAIVATAESSDKISAFHISNVTRWNGRKNPYLYTAKAELLENGEVLDEVSARFGVREFSIDPERGFILNGEEYPLRGVSRHQDRAGVGNALTPEMHREDMDLICELGATTIRLAHYQHDQYFYDLCDERGMVIWAEIPYISQHMPNGRENTISQMKELITQNYNHASIVVWGLSNEITMKGADDPDLIENHRILNDLCHEMDKTRLTTMAIVSMCPTDAEYVNIPDVCSWNHYFGWYGGDVSMNGPWFDKFHAEHPNLPVGVSEYGCEALDWHSSNPKQGDYTEEYQCYYHEECIKQFFSRKYIWATHVWNMFDFAADARAEGGENGMNHKGLVTFDRKYKKDSFYAYKAWLSDDPFVHICSKKYVDRAEDVSRITVYSNLPEVELFANDISLGKKTAEDHFFRFDVPVNGEVTLRAVAGDYEDHSFIRRVEKFNEAYRLREKGAVLNWFDITEVEGYLSLNDSLKDILATNEGKMLLGGLMAQMTASMKKDGGKNAGGFELNEDMLKMISSFTVLRIISMVGMMGVKFSKEQLLAINAQLNKIKKA